MVQIKLNDCRGDLSKSWFLYFWLTTEDGKQVRYKRYISRRIKTASARRQKAHEMTLELRQRLADGWDPQSQSNPGDVKLSVALSHVLAFKKTSVRYRSWQAYKLAVKFLLLYLRSCKLDNIACEDFGHSLAMKYLDWCKIKRNLSNNTYNKYVGHLRTLFNDMVARDYIQKNPFTRIKKLTGEKPGIVALTRSELDMVTRYLPEYNYHLYLVAQLIFGCFLRPAEIVKIRARDVDLSKGIIVVPAGISKNKKQSAVVVPNNCARVMQELRVDLLPGDYYLVGKSLMPGRTPTHVNRLHEAWKGFCQRYDLQHTLYNLKHTGCGMAVEQGINIRDIQLQLRHHSLDMTQQYLDRFCRLPSNQLVERFPEL